MIDKPRIGYAVFDRQANLDAPPRYMPIVIVPGLMGTRLTDPVTDKLVWNPEGLPLGVGPMAFTVDVDRLTQTSAELVPDETHGFDDDSPEDNAVKGIKNYYHIIGEFYGELAKQMATLGADNPVGAFDKIKARVYCCGYDWRLDNAKAALRLAEVVEDALRETRERKVILIAHSMGGLVSRYYCRVLGGESKVHHLFLVGSPTLGAPLAYSQLKHGMPGFYLKDMLYDAQDGDRSALLEEGIQQAADVESAAVGLGHDLMNKAPEDIKAGPEGLKTALGALGDIFLAMCLGAGRMLTRKETTYFARQLPASYQLLPNSLFCRDHPHWLYFDPATTGLPPSGFMIILPTLFEMIADLSPGFRRFFQPEEADRTSPLATRNRDTLVERLEKIGLAVADKNPPTLPGQPKRTPAEEFMLLNANETAAVRLIGELVTRLQAAFIDCRNNRSLYGDIYTGLLDVVELRAVSAANLLVAQRLEDALIVGARPEKAESPIDLVMQKFVLPALAAAPLGPIKSLAGKLVSDKQKADAKNAKDPPKAYMHPRTNNVYCATEAMDPVTLLVPVDVLSNDDSNLVRWMLVPSALIMPILMAALKPGEASSFGSQALGDGTVPATSANPDPAVLSHPFLDIKEVMLVTHTDLTGNKKVLDYLKDQLESLVPSFLAT